MGSMISPKNESTLHPDPGECSHCIIAPYSEKFMELYHDFCHDAIHAIRRWDPNANIDIYQFFDLSVLIEVMFNEHRGEGELGHDYIDAIVTDFPRDVADNLISLLVDFINNAIKPPGFTEVVEQLNRRYYLVQVVISEDDDYTCYYFQDPEE